MKKKSRTRIRGFDALRTLALIGVLLYHTFPRAVPGGYFGVVIFFVLSGFLTAYSSFSSRRLSVLSWYGKRFMRIYPALILMLFCSVQAIAMTDRFLLQNVQEEVLSVLAGYNNYWQISKSTDYFANLAATSAFTHLWYIAILIQFEAVWPLIYLICRFTKRNTAVLFILTLVSLPVMTVRSFISPDSLTALYYATDTRIFALIAGAFAGAVYARRTAVRRRRKNPLPAYLYGLLFTALSVWIFWKVPGTLPTVYHYGLTLYTILTLVMVCLLAEYSREIGGRLDIGIFRFLSRYSYEIYLWQYPVLFLFAVRGWNTAFWHYLIQIAVILILSMWTNTFISSVSSLFKRREQTAEA